MDVQFISEYLEYIEVEKGLSSNTIDAYRRDLTFFLKFCSDKKLSEIDKIERKDINIYILNLREKGFNPRTVMRQIASLRGFFKWLSANEYIQKNPTQLIEQPKLPKRLPKVITLDDILTILNSDLNEPEIVIMELLYGCGLRVSELVNLKISDVELNSKFVKCYGKGGKERIVPFGKKAQNALKKYLKIRDMIILKNNISSKKLLLKENGKL